ncbi:MAG TPA: hypothetical protein VJ464_17490 [Blastocatellia bacterium]|nr:hypothetical protein [Blastocatellia bacterium]
MGNEELKAEADQLMRECRLPELLSAYLRWFVGGSYSYDLMCWRDLDVYILDPRADFKRCFEVAYELTCRLAAKKSRFTNNVGGEPNGLYWGIKLGDERQGAWKLDLWFLDLDSYAEHANYSANMKGKLTVDARSAILEIKEAYWRRPEYRDTVTSDLIYRAVLERGVKNINDFERFLAEGAS